MIVERIPEYKDGITSTFSGGILPENLVNKFDDFSNSIKNKINNYIMNIDNIQDKRM
jgi:hypothetical protein